MKILRASTSAVLGRRLARELTSDELNLIGGGGEKTQTDWSVDYKTTKTCTTTPSPGPGIGADEKCTFG